MLTIGVRIAAGDWTSPAFPTARLAALRKGETDADGLRPVACGEVLRRVVGRAILRAHKEAIVNLLLKTNQFAFSADGALAAFNAIRHHLSLHPEHVCVATDKGSAFQRVSRAEMRRQLLAEMPTFLPYFELLYGEAASLFYEGRELESRHGCQQGCAWGTLLYASAARWCRWQRRRR